MEKNVYCRFCRSYYAKSTFFDHISGCKGWQKLLNKPARNRS